MAANLLQRIRENRRTTVTVGRWKFFARRPTDVEAVNLYRNNTPHYDVARDYVSGWEGVLEDDVVGGGGQDPIPFSKDLWAEWCADRRDLWDPIASAVYEAYALHAGVMESAKGN